MQTIRFGVWTMSNTDDLGELVQHAIVATLLVETIRPEMASLAALNGRAWATSHRIAEGMER